MKHSSAFWRFNVPDLNHIDLEYRAYRYRDGCGGPLGNPNPVIGEDPKALGG